MTLERALHFSPSSVWKEWFYHESEKKKLWNGTFMKQQSEEMEDTQAWRLREDGP